MSEAFQWAVGAAAVVACLGILGQVLILAAMYRAVVKVLKVGKDAQNKFEPLVNRFGPQLDRLEAFITSSSKLINSGYNFLEKNRTRIAEVSAEASLIAKNARQKAERISLLIDDLSGLAKTRIAQTDQRVDHAVEQAEHAREVIKSAVQKPIREVKGTMAGVTAALKTYRSL